MLVALVVSVALVALVVLVVLVVQVAVALVAQSVDGCASIVHQSVALVALVVGRSKL